VITFGKLNLEKNDFPQGVDLKFDHIPAIFMFPAKDKQHPVKYEGNFTFDSLRDFVFNFGSNAVRPVDEEAIVRPVIIDEPVKEDVEEVAGEEHVEL
jgi:hypothetical protein